MGKQGRSRTVAPDEDYVVNYVCPPTIERFWNSKAHVRGLMGPYRSGKSSGCCVFIWDKCRTQRPGADGIRRSKWAIVRNTYPELLTTALQTWLSWYPEEHFGDLVKSIPITYYLKFDDVWAEIIFLALDQEGDVKKLQSLELTAAWVNEAREVPKVIIDHLQGRIGQYPAKKDGGTAWSGLIMDTNPPDEDHWWPKMFGDAPPDEDVEEVWGLDQDSELEHDPNDFELFKQPSGLAPNAENIEHLNDGRLYYTRLARNKDKGFVNVYVHGKYGSSTGELVVYPEFREETHVSKEKLHFNNRLPLYLGWDFGLTPACIVFQVTPRGQLRVLKEIIGKEIGVRRFAKTVVRWHLNREFAGAEIISTGDPSGGYRKDTDESTCLIVLRQEGIPTQPAHTNSFEGRKDAVLHYLEGLADGQPAFLLDPSCKMLKYGFIRGYRYKRIKHKDGDRFINVVDKGNPYSHPHDGLQYGCLRVRKALKHRRILAQGGGGRGPGGGRQPEYQLA